MATNFGQLAFFSESKHQLSLHTALSEQNKSLVASAVAGFFAAFFRFAAIASSVIRGLSAGAFPRPGERHPYQAMPEEWIDQI